MGFHVTLRPIQLSGVKPASRKEDCLGKAALEIFCGVRGRRALNQHLAAIGAAEPVSYEATLPTQCAATHLKTTLTPNLDRTGKVIHLVGTSIDVSSSHERDEALGHVDKWRTHRRIEVMSMNPR